MKKRILLPSRLSGEITIPPSKSAAHRAILCAALARGVSEVSPVSGSDDMEATIGAVRTMGAVVTRSGETLIVDGTNIGREKTPVLDCRESGSTLRFLIPAAAALGLDAAFIGAGRLPQRPIGVYLDCLPRAGVSCETSGGLPLKISGRLRAGEFSLPGNVSSQFITGLLLALPLLPGDSEIRLTSPLESAGYLDMTLEMMQKFGVTAEKTPQGYKIPGGQEYRPRKITVEGDWSQAAFFFGACVFGGTLTVRGLAPDSTQGDRAALALFRKFGMRAEWTQDGALFCRPPEGTPAPQEIDAAQIPDLVPMLALTAAGADGVTRITNAARLRIKESDRLKTTAALVRAFGRRCGELPDGLVIYGDPAPFCGARADGAGDHRIVMAAAIGALGASGETKIDGAQAVRKSYPDFFEDYARLGGKTDVIGVG